jgi:hypothetical protein
MRLDTEGKATANAVNKPCEWIYLTVKHRQMYNYHKLSERSQKPVIIGVKYSCKYP